MPILILNLALSQHALTLRCAMIHAPLSLVLIVSRSHSRPRFSEISQTIISLVMNSRSVFHFYLIDFM